MKKHLFKLLSLSVLHYLSQGAQNINPLHNLHSYNLLKSNDIQPIRIKGMLSF